MKKYVLLTVFATMGTAAMYTGCTTNIKPLEPIRREVMWVPDEAGTQAGTGPGTQEASTRQSEATTRGEATTQVEEGKAIPEFEPLLTAQDDFKPETQPSTQAATQAATRATKVASTEPGAGAAPVRDHRGEHVVVKVIDPNETTRYVYHGSYDNIWQQSMMLLTKMGFMLDRKDYRLGVLTTQALPSAQWVEPWKGDQTTFKNAMENTVNTQRRTVRLTISKVPEKPEFYEIAVQVLVEREYNPLEDIGGPVFVEGSGFGRAQVSLRSDYAPADTKNIGPGWYVVGHDPNLEKKILSELFKHI